MRRDLDFMHCYAGGIGTWNLCIVMLEELGFSLPTPLPWRSSLVLQSLEAEFFGEEKQQN